MFFFRRIRALISLFFHMMRVIFQLLYGFWRVSKLENLLVSIFGSARIAEDQIYYRQAHDLARRFIEHDISVLTGGGPGIMEAVSCGALVHDDTTGKEKYRYWGDWVG